MADGINLLERLVQQANIRNSVLASNLANVDTPNYRAKDVKFSQVLGGEIRIVTTDPRHISSSPDGGASGEINASDAQPWADHNTVELDVEVAKMTENGMFLEAGITLLKKKIQMFKNALKTT